MNSSVFHDSKRNQINVAIIGAVSAGKSTLLNALFVKTYSEMKIKRNTMTPQVYYETDDLECCDAEEIKENNSNINSNLNSKEKGTLTLDDIQEISYVVPRVKNLHELGKDVFLTVYDIPGLNDSQTKDTYFEYLSQNFYKFDIILLLIDINSALNTSDESEILENILKNAKLCYEKYGIQQKFIVVVNKCDDLNYLDELDEFEFQDEELGEMYDQIEKLIDERINDIFPKIEFGIVPLSSENSYIYRMFDENPEYELDIKHINKFGCNEYGRSRWNRLSQEDRVQKIKELMKDMDIDETLTHTGFTGFSDIFKSYLDYENQFTFLNNHLIYGVSQITDFTNLDISHQMSLFYEFYQRYCEINNLFFGENEDDDEEGIFFCKLNKFITNYEESVISQYVNLDSHCLKNNNYLEKVENMKKNFETYKTDFNKESSAINRISSELNNTLNNFYQGNIKSNTSQVSILMEYLWKLFHNKFRIDTELVKTIFRNQDMKNKTPMEVIKELETLEEKNLINSEDKEELLYNFLCEIYSEIRSHPEYKVIDTANKNIYFYYADLFWSTVVNKQFDIDILEKTQKIDFARLGYAAKQNMIHYLGTDNEHLLIWEKSPLELIILEYYLYKLYKTNKGIQDDFQISGQKSDSKLKDKKYMTHTNKKDFSRPKKRGRKPNISSSMKVKITPSGNSKNTDVLDAGNISDDLDRELGLDVGN